MYYGVQFALLSCLKNVEKHGIANSLKNSSKWLKDMLSSFKANVQFWVCPSGFKGHLVFYMLNIIFGFLVSLEKRPFQLIFCCLENLECETNSDQLKK